MITTPKEFETKVRELYGIPLDYDLDSIADDELETVLGGHWVDMATTYVKGITGRYCTEEAHYEVDKMTLDMLTELGYGSAARIIKNIEKWYA